MKFSIVGFVTTLCVVAFIPQGTKANRCFQTMNNDLQHPAYGPLKMVSIPSLSTLQGGQNSWSNGHHPLSINYKQTTDWGGDQGYSWGMANDGAINIYARYKIVEQFPKDPFNTESLAEFTILTVCNEESHNDYVNIIDCKSLNGDKEICYDLGLKNVGCSDGPKENDSAYTATIVVDGSGVQNNNHLCPENYSGFIGVMQSAVDQCFSDWNLNGQVNALQGKHDEAQKQYENLQKLYTKDQENYREVMANITFLNKQVKQIVVEIQRLKGKKQKQEVQQQQQQQQQQQEDSKVLFIKNFLKGNRNNNVQEDHVVHSTPNDTADITSLKQKLNSTMYEIDVLKIQRKKDAALVDEEKLKLKAKMVEIKNDHQALVNLKNFIRVNTCSQIQQTLGNIVNVVIKLMNKIKTFLEANACSLLWQASDAIGLLLNTAEDFIPGVGEFVMGLQAEPECLGQFEGSMTSFKHWQMGDQAGLPERRVLNGNLMPENMYTAIQNNHASWNSWWQDSAMGKVASGKSKALDTYKNAKDGVKTAKDKFMNWVSGGPKEEVTPDPEMSAAQKAKGALSKGAMLLSVITALLCNGEVLSLLPSHARSVVKNDICLAAELSEAIMNIIFSAMCGDFGTVFVDIIQQVAICPMTMFGNKCSTVLGSKCVIEQTASKMFPKTKEEKKPSWQKVAEKQSEKKVEAYLPTCKNQTSEPVVWAVNSNQAIFYFNKKINNWVNFPGGLKNVASGGGQVWGTNNEDRVFNLQLTRPEFPNYGQFQEVPGNYRLKQVDVGCDGEVWGVTSSGTVWKFNHTNNKFEVQKGLLKQISVGRKGDVWGVNNRDQVFYWDEKINDWQYVQGYFLNQIEVGCDGSVIGVNSGQQIFRWIDNKFVWYADGLLSWVSQNKFNQEVWGVNSNQAIFKNTTQGWVNVPGGLSQIDVGSSIIC
eukprot:Pgem_evm1s11577